MTEAIDYFSKGHILTQLRTHYARKAREHMFQKFMHVFSPTPSTRVMDLGVTPDTSLPESNYFEQRYPWPEKLTAVSIEDVSNLSKVFPSVQFQKIPPGPLPFATNSFDIVFCSAVLEHVGTRENQQAFLDEIIRVSRSFLITTPNRWFPLEFHTFVPLAHWLPQAQHQAFLRRIGKPFWAETTNLNLLSASDLNQLLKNRLDGIEFNVENVKLFGWPSNLLAWGIKS